MPRVKPKPTGNVYEASIIKTSQRYSMTVPIDIGRYVKEHNGTLLGSFKIKNGKMTLWINNIKGPLKEKIKQLNEGKKERIE